MLAGARLNLPVRLGAEGNFLKWMFPGDNSQVDAIVDQALAVARALVVQDAETEDAVGADPLLSSYEGEGAAPENPGYVVEALASVFIEQGYLLNGELRGVSPTTVARLSRCQPIMRLPP